MLILASAPSGFDNVVTLINDPVSAFAWGWPTVGLISITGILLMLGLRFMPILRLPYGVRMMLASTERHHLNQGDSQKDSPSNPFSSCHRCLSRQGSKGASSRCRCGRSSQR